MNKKLEISSSENSEASLENEKETETHEQENEVNANGGKHTEKNTERKIITQVQESTKLNFIVRELQEMNDSNNVQTDKNIPYDDATQSDDQKDANGLKQHRPHKAVVFSQFTKFLDIVAQSVCDAGISYVRLDGSMSLQRRADSLASFTTELSGVNVLLVSLKAGGTGLNLVCANRLYMLDPWWNPSIEQQAIDRVYRIGQTREVTVKRLIVQDSVEQTILKLQEKKKNMVESALDKKKMQEVMKLSMAELAECFGLNE